MRILVTALVLMSISCQEQQLFTPIQVEAKRWVHNNPDVPWESFETHIVSGIKNFEPVDTFQVNQYRSDISKKFQRTGYFKIEKQDERWWMVDPEGFAHIEIAVVGFRQGTSKRNKNAFYKKFETEDVWVELTSRKFHSYGFNGVAAWSNNDAIIQHNAESNRKMTYSPILNFMSSYGRKRGGIYQLPGNTGYPNQTIFVFDPEFKVFCDEYAKQVSQFKNDPNLVGYFSDNELPFGLKNLAGYLEIENPNDPGRIVAENWLKTKGIAIDKITDKERSEFAGLVADRYFSIVSEAIKKYDPNHMYFGSRLHWKAKFIKEIVQAAGRYCDVIAINYYGSWAPDPAVMQNWGEWAGKPFIITEFYTKGMDSGLANTTGAGWTVHTQKDRGCAYQHFCLSLLESGNCVGWNWFKYQDNDPDAVGVDPSNRDSNKGMVDNDYNYYEDLVGSMQQLNINVYRLADFFDSPGRSKK